MAPPLNRMESKSSGFSSRRQSYSGPTAINSGNPTPLLPVGHSLARVSLNNDNETDFDCGDPATPENNARTIVNLDATVVFCPEPSTALAQLAAIGSVFCVRIRTHGGVGAGGG